MVKTQRTHCVVSIIFIVWNTAGTQDWRDLSSTLKLGFKLRFEPRCLEFSDL